MTSRNDVSGIMSRPQEPKQPQELDENSPNYEIELAFAITGMDRSDLFSQFFPLHRQIASKLIDYFISIDSFDNLVKVANYGRDNINPNLFNYAFSMAISNRSDSKNTLLLSPAEVFPDKFFSAPLFQEAIEELTVVPEGSRIPVSVDVQNVTAESYDETRLEYFRHDLSLNVCYFFWHLTHPFEASQKYMVDIDRRGELWCYFHQQIIARYNAERYCNGLLPVVPLSNLDNPIEEGYFPKLTTQHSSHSWASRFENSYLCDLKRPYEGLSIHKTQLQRWINRICNAIELGRVLSEDGTEISLNNDKGIDILGNLLQSSILSPNRKFYGDIANIGHAFIAYCHDPQNLALQSYGVMGEPATCMRDMLFYRWYAFITRIINLHKMQLPSYTENELGFNGVRITSFDIKDSQGGTNVLSTHWDQGEFNLKNGLNYQPDGNVYARITYLQHNNFQYDIDIQNDQSNMQNGTIRIFISQKNDARDRELTFEELRMSMIELDRFNVQLNPGQNHIERQSSDSAVIVPDKNYFEPEAVRQDINSKAKNNASYCLSGWPSHLLIPMGMSQGAEFLVFTMISKDDKIENSTKSSNDSIYEQCDSGSSYCGLANRKYPNKRSMGFPFDRPAGLEVLTMKHFLLSNMKTQDVIIKFSSKD